LAYKLWLFRWIDPSNPALSAAFLVFWELEGCTSFVPDRSQRARDRSIRLFIHLLIVVDPSKVVLRCDHLTLGSPPAHVRYPPMLATTLVRYLPHVRRLTGSHIPCHPP